MLIDGHGRVVDYLRVSVTERCNFRCQYCMPEKPFTWVPRENLLSYEDLFEFIKIAIDAGVKKVRITGGEPTVRDDLDRFISLISSYAPTIDLAMTTNGYLLGDQAPRLAAAGLGRINISLDSLNPQTAQHIAQKDVLSHVLRGIEKAQEVGMKVKINMVPLVGINAHEMGDIIEYGRARNIPVRFIEYMENSYANQSVRGLDSDAMLKVLGATYTFHAVEQDTSSPARYYALDDGYEFGIIEPHKDDFCASCNRLRLTAEGHLIPCLYFDEAMNIREAIKAKDIKKAAAILGEVLANKPEKNRWSGEGEQSDRAFYHTGG